MRGLAEWIISPAVIGRVANTPRPAELVYAIRMGGGSDRNESDFAQGPVEVAVEKSCKERRCRRYGGVWRRKATESIGEDSEDLS
jgi:hypothetical protein